MYGKLLKMVRRRRWRTVSLLILFLGAAAGLYAYALHQWQAAQSALQRGQVSEAHDRLKLCLLIWPRSPAVQLLAARAARMSGEFAQAEAHLNRCLKLSHQETAAIELEFLLLRVQGGEVDEVAPLLWQCVEDHNPETPLILETLAQAYLYNLRYGPALYYLNRCIQEAPERARPYYWRGWVLEHLNDRTSAGEDYRRAVELDPDFVTARLHLAEFCLQMANAEEAAPHLEHLNRQFPDRPDVLARLGHCRFLQGRNEEARRLLEAAVEKLPDDPYVLIQLGRLEIQQGQPSKAEHYLRRALTIDPTDAEVQYLLADSLRKQDRFEEAEAVLEQHRQNEARLKRFTQLLREATERPLTDPDALCEIGRLFLDGKQERLGLYWLQQALEHDPAHPPTLQALADYYEKIGQAAKAAVYRGKLKPAGHAVSAASVKRR
jgi:tetratricopeptide (TPR) repeat protein